MAAEALRTTLAANLAVDDSVGFEYPGPEGDLRRVVAAPGLTSGLMVAGVLLAMGSRFGGSEMGSMELRLLERLSPSATPLGPRKSKPNRYFRAEKGILFGEFCC